MQRWIGRAMVVAMVVACADQAPSPTEGGTPTVSARRAVPATVFNTQLRAELESPATTSESKGHAQIKVFQDGTIESVVIINNKGNETVWFGHIHHLSPASATGPVIWWLTAPTGTNLMLTDRHIDIRQQAAFVANTHFETHEDAVAALLADPSSFYVNFHSEAFTGGFARGFLR